ncbi:MAG TPA: histidine phosphatase family protein [Pseudomonadales bacterium]|nr:histidine phosphatase family protein [Pseudomonadales bacterium]
MKLFFLRHGEAAPDRNDDIRELTLRGREDVAQVAKSCGVALRDIEQVLVSPITRAQQTADIFCAEAGIRVPRQTVGWLVHETPVREALDALRSIDKNTLLVGHQPLAGSLVERLCNLERGASFIGTANLVEMEGDAFVTGALQLLHHQSP